MIHAHVGVERSINIVMGRNKKGERKRSPDRAIWISVGIFHPVGEHLTWYTKKGDSDHLFK